MLFGRTQAALNPNSSFGDVVKAALVGGASNFLTGRAAFDALYALIGNLASQTTDPCFKGLNLKQAAVAVLLSKFNVGKQFSDKYIQPTSNVKYIGNKALSQVTNSSITGVF